MKPFIFGERSNIHIIDLSQTVPLLHQALVKVREVAAGGGGRIPVCLSAPKRQAQEPIRPGRPALRALLHEPSLARRHTLTNWRTISISIGRLRELEGILDQEGGPAGPHQKRNADALGVSVKKLGALAWRHQGDGRHTRPHLS